MNPGDMIRVDRGPFEGRSGRLIAIRGDETFEIQETAATKVGEQFEQAIITVPGRHCRPDSKMVRLDSFSVRRDPRGGGLEQVIDHYGLLVAQCDGLDADLLAAAPALFRIVQMAVDGLRAGKPVSDAYFESAAITEIVDRLRFPRVGCPECGGTGDVDDDTCPACAGRGTVAGASPATPRSEQAAALKARLAPKSPKSKRGK